MIELELVDFISVFGIHYFLSSFLNQIKKQMNRNSPNFEILKTSLFLNEGDPIQCGKSAVPDDVKLYNELAASSSFRFLF